MTTVYPIGNPKKIFMRAMASFLEGDFIVDAENKKQIADLVGYFSKTFTSLNPRKGILLIGNPGSGKTILLELFGTLVRNVDGLSFKIMTCADASRNYSLSGEKSLAKLFQGNYFFDDLGNEPAANHFGKRELLSDIIFDAYNVWRKSGYTYHFTTNASPEEIKSRYGEHCWSRLNQMCNVVGLGTDANSSDRRIASLPNVLKDLEQFPKFFITDAEKRIQEANEAIKKQYQELGNAPRQRFQSKPLGQQLKESFGMAG